MLVLPLMIQETGTSVFHLHVTNNTYSNTLSIFTPFSLECCCFNFVSLIFLRVWVLQDVHSNFISGVFLNFWTQGRQYPWPHSFSGMK